MHIDDLCVKFDKEYGNQGNSEFIWHLYDPAKDDRLCLVVEMRIETMGDTDIVENLTLFEEHFLIVKDHNKKTKVMKMTGKDPLSDISHDYVSASEYGENGRVNVLASNVAQLKEETCRRFGEVQTRLQALVPKIDTLIDS